MKLSWPLCFNLKPLTNQPTTRPKNLHASLIEYHSKLASPLLYACLLSKPNKNLNRLQKNYNRWLHIACLKTYPFLLYKFQSQLVKATPSLTLSLSLSISKWIRLKSLLLLLLLLLPHLHRLRHVRVPRSWLVSRSMPEQAASCSRGQSEWLLAPMTLSLPCTFSVSIE